MARPDLAAAASSEISAAQPLEVCLRACIEVLQECAATLIQIRDQP